MVTAGVSLNEKLFGYFLSKSECVLSVKSNQENNQQPRILGVIF